jgi:adenine-specific DNA-methyltransferase
MEKKLKHSKKTNNKWFETQDSISYWEDFFKQKIVWARLMRLSKDDINNFPRFSFVVSKYFVVDSLCFFTGSAINYLIGILNSEFAKYYFFNNVAVLDNGGMQMRQQYIEQIPIPSADNSQMESIIQATKLSDYNLVDNIVNQLWKFSTEEIKAIKECIKEKEYAIINDLKR